MKFGLVRWGALALMIGTLAGCGGGDDAVVGGTPAAAPAAGAGAAAGGGAAAGAAPSGIVAAAAAAPAATNTAQNPAQAFGLVAATGGAVVTIQSPPVVNLTVIDSTGKFVSGLQLVNTSAASNAAATTAEPNCSGSNVTFAISKWTGTYW